MDWISSLFRSKGESAGLPGAPAASTPKFEGLSPDDSLNKSSEDDATENGTKPREPSLDEDFVMDLDESPPEKEENKVGTKKDKWISTNYKPQFDHTSLDFGRIDRQGFGSPLIVRIYRKNEGSEMKTQVGVYEDVDPFDVEECLMEQNQAYTKNLVLIIEEVDSDNLELYQEALRSVLPAIFSRRCKVVRFVFWMDRWDFVAEFASIFSEFCTRLLELNIGAPLLPSLPLPHPPPPSEIEAEGVGKLLLKWLPSISSTLRCLRIYSVVQATDTFSSSINGCYELRHLTLSKFDELRSTIEFSNIRSFELDKQFLAYTDDDLSLIKRLCFHFPGSRIFSFSGCRNDPLVEGALKRFSERKEETFELYQPSMKLEEVADSVRVRFVVERTNPSGTRNPKSMMLWNERYDSRVLLHRADSVFLTPIRDSPDDWP